MVAETTMKARVATLDDIADAVGRYYSVTVDDLRREDRTARISLPRQVFYLLSRNITACTYEEIGRFLGRDHSTVYDQVATIERKRSADRYLAYDIGVIESEIATIVGERAPVISTEPTKIEMFEECRVKMSRYVFGLDDLIEAISSKSIPRRAWVEAIDLGMDSIRLTFRWSKDDGVAS